MAAPAVPATATQLYDELGPSHPYDEELGWPFLIFLAGVARTLGELADIVRDSSEGPGWSVLMDPVRAPGWALPWLAQFAGTTVTPDAPDAQQRAEIVAHSSFTRGTPAAMRAAGALHLTGSKTVSMLERHESPYRLTLFTRTSETPDPQQTFLDLLNQKPAGLLLTHVVVAGVAWDEAAATWDSAPAGLTWDETLTETV